METQLSPLKGAKQFPTFRPMSIVVKRLDGQNATWYRGRPRPSEIVLDVTQLPSHKKGHGSLPHFSAHLRCGETAGWIIPLGTEVGLSPGDVLDGDPAPPTERGTAGPTFRLMSIVARRSPISATAELLFAT